MRELLQDGILLLVVSIQRFKLFKYQLNAPSRKCKEVGQTGKILLEEGKTFFARTVLPYIFADGWTGYPISFYSLQACYQ